MKITYDVTEAQVGEFPQPTPGLYPAKIFSEEVGDSKAGNPMLTLVFEIKTGEFKNSRLWHYIMLDGSADWRLREVTDALGFKAKGSLDTAKLVGGDVLLRITGQNSEEYGYQARVKNVLKAAGEEEDESEDEEPDEEDGDDEAPYSEWTLTELREELAERELTIRGKTTKEKLVAALEANDEDLAGEDEEPEDEPEEEPEPEPATRGRRARRGAVQYVDPEPEDEGEEDESEEDEEDGEAEDYSEWDMEDLKAELQERGLRTVGKKSVLISRLERDDAEGDDEPF